DAAQKLIRNFFLAEKYKRGSSKPAAEKITHAAVIGAGVMGSGIAQWLSSRGVSVILRDVGTEELTRGLATIEKTYADAVKRGIMTEEKAKEGRARIVASSAPIDMRDVQIVMEAASETLEIKKEIVRDRPGFLVNRVLFPYLLEAAELFENGVDAQEIDEALLEWGMPMGPLRLIDEIGVDIAVDIANTLEQAYGKRDRAPKILREMQSAKMVGRKSGGGFYKYEGKSQTPNAEIEKWRGANSVMPSEVKGSGDESLKVTRRDPSTALRSGRDDVANRLTFLMVNESARCLEENVVASPEDADYGMILGTGFPAWRGGPLRFAESFGIKKLVEEMEK